MLFVSLTTELQAAINRDRNANVADEDSNSGCRLFLVGTESTQDALQILETIISASIDAMVLLAKQMDAKSDTVAKELKIGLTRTQGLEAAIGERLEVSNSSLEAPNVWSSITLLTSAIDELHKTVDKFPDALKETAGIINATESILRRELHAASLDVQKQIDSSIAANAEYYRSLSDSMITLARNANTMRKEIRAIQNFPIEIDGEANNTQATEIAELKLMVKDLTIRLDAVAEERASKAAKFFGITLRSNNKCNDWVKSNLDDDSLGVIMDVHLVLEHIFYQMYAGEGLLKTL